MIERVIKIDIIAVYSTSYAPLLPLVPRPYCLAQILTREMRTRRVVLAPFARRHGSRRANQNLLELGVADALGFRPCGVREMRRPDEGCEKGRGLNLMVTKDAALPGSGHTEDDNNEGKDGDAGQSDGAQAAELEGNQSAAL